MSDQILTTAGFWLAWFGFAVLVFALFFNRVRRLWTKHRRCPKCWYDMSHTPGLTCSECGKTVKRERSLRKVKPRRRLAIVAFLILLIGYAGQVTPGVKARGWVAAVPTPVLLCAVPFLHPYEAGVHALVRPMWVQGNIAQGLTPTIDDRLVLELAQRITEEGVPRSHWNHLLCDIARLLDGPHASPSGEPYTFRNDEAWLGTTVRWKSYDPFRVFLAEGSPEELRKMAPIEVEFIGPIRPNDPVYIKAPRFFGTEKRISVTPQDVDGHSVEFIGEFRGTTNYFKYPAPENAFERLVDSADARTSIALDIGYWVTEYGFVGEWTSREWRVHHDTITVVLPIDHDMTNDTTPVESQAELDEFVSDLLPQLSRSEGGLDFSGLGAHMWNDADDLTFGCRIDIEANGNVVGSREYWCMAHEVVQSFKRYNFGYKTEDHEGFQRLLDDPTTEWTLTLDCSRIVAFRNPDLGKYIVGRVTIPVEIVP
ncbi:MAG: hypothetical protein AAF432_06960 [Planctomycetota bacterium]